MRLSRLNRSGSVMGAAGITLGVPARTGRAMIEIKQLSKRFGSFTAVDGISLAVGRGEVLGFLGPNGAGKSTTMKMVTGYLSPSGGTALVSGHDVVADPLSVKRAIGYLPEGAPAYPDMTPESFLMFCARARGMRRSAARRRVDEVVGKVQLHGVMRQSIETLSKGFKRRVGLAQAILHDPDVLIMDEPTDGLDPNQKHEVRSLIRAMSSHKAILLSTHILEEVEAVCTRAVVINRGKLVFDGTPLQFQQRSKYHNAVTLSVRGAGPSAEAVAAELRAVPMVANVEVLGMEGGSMRLTLVPKNRQSLVQEVGRLARSRGWEVDGLTVDAGRLDDVFRELTTGMGGQP